MGLIVHNVISPDHFDGGGTIAKTKTKKKKYKMVNPLVSVGVMAIFAANVAKSNIILYLELMGSFLFGMLYMGSYDFVHRVKK